jgi:hypothetical protein
MLRNKQEQKLKYLRRLDAYQDTLDTHTVEYIPVEKPFFVGWDVYITLSESGMRRRDAPDILAVLDILGASKKQFTKSVRFIRYLRRFHYSVELTAGQYEYKHYRWRHPNSCYFPYWYQTGLNAYYIDERKFEQVPAHLRHYFYEDKDSYYRKYVRHKVYRLSFMNSFPLYELVYKVEKSYANALGVPRGDDISEDNMISDILSNNHYWSSKKGTIRNGHDNFYQHMSNIMHRRAWKQFCHNMKNSDFSDEAEEQSRKCLKNQKYKW